MRRCENRRVSELIDCDIKMVDAGQLSRIKLFEDNWHPQRVSLAKGRHPHICGSCLPTGRVFFCITFDGPLSPSRSTPTRLVNLLGQADQSPPNSPTVWKEIVTALGAMDGEGDARLGELYDLLYERHLGRKPWKAAKSNPQNHARSRGGEPVVREGGADIGLFIAANMVLFARLRRQNQIWVPTQHAATRAAMPSCDTTARLPDCRVSFITPERKRWRKWMRR